MAPSDDTKAPAIDKLSLATRSVHADDHISVHRAVAPAVHVSTTFRYSDDPEQLLGWGNVDVSARTSIACDRQKAPKAHSANLPSPTPPRTHTSTRATPTPTRRGSRRC